MSSRSDLNKINCLRTVLLVMVYSFHAFLQCTCIAACQLCADILPGADNVSVHKTVFIPAEMAGEV